MRHAEHERGAMATRAHRQSVFKTQGGSLHASMDASPRHGRGPTTTTTTAARPAPTC